MSLAECKVGDIVRFEYSSPEGTSVEGFARGVPLKYFNRTSPYVGRSEDHRNMIAQPMNWESELILTTSVLQIQERANYTLLLFAKFSHPEHSPMP